MSNENNGGGEHPNGTRRVMISLDVHTQHIHIDCGGTPLDEALGMMERARLEIDARFRFARGRELLIEQVQQDQLAGVARDVMAGRKIQA